MHLAHFALLIDDYDTAIAYYTNVLGFILLEDTQLDEHKRWVRVATAENAETSILLAKASNEQQLSRVGNQTGGRVFLFLHTNNFADYYERLLQHQVKIIRPVVHEAWGTVCVFEDMYGNLWDLIQPITNGNA
jgi:catechol 2,3-dioxygenase-like lactoylglutathione lyase family enzyme